MVAALANGARALGDPSLAERARRAATFVWEHLRAADGSLLRRWRDGEAAGAGQLDDHAYFAHACLELFLATQDPVWLSRAAETTRTMIARFWDETDGGFFDSPATAPSTTRGPGAAGTPAPTAGARGRPARPLTTGGAGEAGAPRTTGGAGEAGAPSTTGGAGEAGGLPRLKDAYDGAELAGNSIAAEVLWRLGWLLERPQWRDLAARSFEFHSRRLASAPWAMPRMLAAMERAAAPSRHLVIAGEPNAEDTRALVAAFESRLRPDTDLVVVSSGTRGALASLAPFAAALPVRDDRATAYLCLDHACRQPVHDPAELAAQLDA